MILVAVGLAADLVIHGEEDLIPVGVMRNHYRLEES